jgi:RNA polymerase sigma-70 factor (ECF subfamily)
MPSASSADSSSADLQPIEWRGRAGSGGWQTDWSMVLRASGRDGSDSAHALERLARRYWPAIFAYLRSQGRGIHEAADLTQGFLCDVVLGRDLLSVANQQRGRFRSLLLTALENYVRDQHRRSRRLKRAAGGQPTVPVESAELEATVGASEAPQAAFATQWGTTLLRHVLEQVRSDCCDQGLGVHWEVFERRIIRPALLGDPPADYPALVVQLGLRSPSQAANMVVTVKRRLVRALLEEVQRTVGDPTEVESEIRDLLRDLERGR